jgi:hypothetical protein
MFFVSPLGLFKKKNSSFLDSPKDNLNCRIFGWRRSGN